MYQTTSVYMEQLEELFEDVQKGEVFPDQKTFTDCIPKYSTTEILNKYRKEKGEIDFSLKAFFNSNFKILKNDENDFKSNVAKGLNHHIVSLWDVLLRKSDENQGSLIALPHQYIVPGGRFGELFYWDSYFTMLGLQVSKRVDLIESMINNFAYLIEQFGFIPNGNRTYFLSRSQPPFFAFMIDLLAEEKGNSIYIKYLPYLIKEHNFWTRGKEVVHETQKDFKHIVKMPDGEILNRYWDAVNKPRPESFLEDTHTALNADEKIYQNIRAACESGWDFSSRWFKDEKNLETAYTTDIVPIDLNSLLWHLEKTIAKAEGYNNNENSVEHYNTLAENRLKSIQKYLWSDDLKIYTDFDISSSKQTGFSSIAMTYPLFTGLATQIQANEIATKINKYYLKPGGLLTTLNHSGQQWDAPNGWAPLQWITYKGLLNYNHTNLAQKISNNWTKNIEQHFELTGKVAEKYNVENLNLVATGGEYPNQDGFGWTNGVYLKLKQELELNKQL